MSRTRSHIVLMGFMGSGKSTIGKLLSDNLGVPQLDTDVEIEKRTQKTISQLFAEEGEAFFRSMEQNILIEYLRKKDPLIITTGGGTPCQPRSIEAINKYSFSFYLKVGQPTLLHRIYSDKTRPLVAGKTKRELEQFIDGLLMIRRPFYERADFTIQANRDRQKVVRRIIKLLENTNYEGGYNGHWRAPR